MAGGSRSKRFDDVRPDRGSGPVRRRRRPWRSLWVIGMLLGLAAACGASYQQRMARLEERRYPPPGTLVDVGGHRLHLSCTGRGRPTVILEAGLPGSSLDWTLVQPKLAKLTTVCAYDRAGYGWSEPGPRPRTSLRITDELHALLGQAGVFGPYVLVGHSLGGLHVRLYASRFPTQVGGVVLVDVPSEEAVRRRPPRVVKLLWCEVEIWFGLRRLEQALGLDGDAPKLPSTVRQVAAARAMRPATCRAAHDEASVEAESLWEVRQAAGLGSKPLMVVTRGRDLDPPWRAGQAALLRLSTNSSQVVAPGSGHHVQLDRPDVVVEAVRTVLAAARGAGRSAARVGLR
jgi:pimeloyl-ACP methyl ester carboxylesterase